MINIKVILKLLFVAFIISFFQCLIFLFNDNLMLSQHEILMSVLYGNIDQQGVYIGKISTILIPHILISILFGNYICKDICDSGIYGFIRYKSRMQWFIKKILELFTYCTIYSLIYISAVALLTSISSNLFPDKVFILILLISFLQMSLLIFILTVSINMLSIKLGNTNSFIVCLSVLFICAIGALLNKVQIISNDITDKLNPIKNYMLNWHETKLSQGNDIWSLTIIKGFSVGYSIVYFIVLALTLLILSLIYINHIDLSLYNKEAE